MFASTPLRRAVCRLTTAASSGTPLSLSQRRAASSVISQRLQSCVTQSRTNSMGLPLPSFRRGPSAHKRAFSVSAASMHGHLDPPKPGEELWVTFIDKDGVEVKVAVSHGDNLLDIAQANDVEMEGACGGSCACSTCHVIVTNEEYYDRIPEPDDDENDMLDLAFGLTETSRLGCQVKMTKELDGLVVKLPSMTRNLQANDFKA